MNPRPLPGRVLIDVSILWLGFSLPAMAPAQASMHLRGHIRDASGHAARGASLFAEGPSGEVKVTSAADGSFLLDYPGLLAGTVALRATTATMQSDPILLTPATAAAEIDIVLHPSVVRQQITVTATRSSADLPATANTVYALSARDLNNYPASALDDKLRQQPGFELFRRATSHVANPTSQGISLRGLGSTAASRTLVLEDSVPLNDPFGGWIHWDEIPVAAVESITIATGGASDLYGSSALGGVIDLLPAHPSSGRIDASLFGGGQDTSSLGLRTDAARARWSQLLAAEALRTAGYVPIAPTLQGPVDTPANVHYQAVRSETDRTYGNAGRVFLVGNMLNEARGNGTPIQTNATRLWRYIGGDDWTASPRATGRLRLYGSDQAYRQSFSAINAARTSETLTRRQRVRTQELGGSSDASLSLSPVALVIGADLRDIRATDNETPFTSGAPTGLVDTSARQRFLGGFGEALAAHNAWSAALSLRLDAVSNLDTQSITQPGSAIQPVVTPNRSEFIASPRFGVVRQLASVGAVHASVFRAFRSPTMNELYRTGQVGQETTQANAQLQSERATGWELGANFASRANSIALTATYFWTQINRPVSAVFLSSTATSILNKRENLGQILSRGTELHLELRPRPALFASIGYQYSHAIVTRFSAQPALVGNWIPEVPRHSVTAQMRAQNSRLGEVTLAARASGHAFDDSANSYTLHRFFSLDLAARHSFGPHWTASATLQNLLNQRPDVARTPILTLGSPFLAQGGLAFHWDRIPPH